MGDSERLSRPALELLAKLGAASSLRQITAAGGELRERAWALLGECGDVSDLARAIASPPGDEALAELVLGMHFRGLFPPPGAAAVLLELFLKHALDEQQLLRVTFTIRDELFAELARLEPETRRLILISSPCYGTRTR